jgi:hypothetical protein
LVPVGVCAFLRADEEELIGLAVADDVAVEAPMKNFSRPRLSHGPGYIGLYKVSWRGFYVLV